MNFYKKGEHTKIIDGYGVNISNVVVNPEKIIINENCCIRFAKIRGKLYVGHSLCAHQKGEGSPVGLSFASDFDKIEDYILFFKNYLIKYFSEYKQDSKNLRDIRNYFAELSQPKQLTIF